jgi:hypothetical protein
MNPDYIKLAESAAKLVYDTVLTTMLEGEQTHPGNEWQTVDILDHAQHALDHVADAQYEINHGEKLGTDDHIAHAITRLVMVKAVQDVQKR